MMDVLQEPIHVRNRELLFLKEQLQKRLEELQREANSRGARTLVAGASPKLSTGLTL